MLAILFALITFFGWGVGDIFGAVATRKVGAYATAFWFDVIALMLFGFYVPFALPELRNLTPSLLVLTTFLGIIGIAGLISFYEGLRIGNASLVGTISASFGAVVVLLSIVFLGEKISVPQGVSIAIIFVGLLLSSLDLAAVKKGRLFDKSIYLALLAMACWAIYFTFLKIPVQKIGWFWPTAISIASGLIALSTYMKARRIKLVFPKNASSLTPLVANAVLLSIADLSYNVGIMKGLVSVVAPISGSYPALFVVLAFLIFKDPLRMQEVVGIVTTLIGIVLLSFFSV